MTARIRSIDYDHDGHALRGDLAWDDAWSEPRPCVVVVHDAMKSDQGFEQERAVTLAGLGYAGFVLDVYGRDVHASTNEASFELMKPFQEDRLLLQRRLRAGIAAAAAQPEVDADRMAAIGYCFGGMCVLDLARMNAPVLGVGSFHGLLTPPDLPAESERGELADGLARPIAPRVIVFHGWSDPYAPPDSTLSFAREMSERGADWQLHAYGHTLHSFTNPRYDDPEAGVAYDEKAERRSWQSLGRFLEELFAPTSAR